LRNMTIGICLGYSTVDDESGTKGATMVVAHVSCFSSWGWARCIAVCASESETTVVNTNKAVAREIMTSAYWMDQVIC
jgi:hypothetical protein